MAPCSAGGASAANIRFGHAETIMPFVTLLGLFRDDAGLYANATLAEMRRRKFRASHIAPYSANAYLVLYACDEGASACPAPAV
jgi:multiple inositol-polyphosphate phosphatase/2,3-bisphosphoglycerate 3-phosphatase